jgi:hypothetical protein
LLRAKRLQTTVPLLPSSLYLDAWLQSIKCLDSI